MSEAPRFSFSAVLVHHIDGPDTAEIYFRKENDGLFVHYDDYARLKAEVERLRKTAIDPSKVKGLVEEGVQDIPFHYSKKYTIEVSRDAFLFFEEMMMEYWNAAKEGKPSV